ncbi:ParA family protein, partial [Salmonella enterica]|nr:ParA family protein [Salmonella enterica subsp. enterica serovar Kentucky]
MAATKVTFGNFKGGTGKTTNCSMIGYILAKQGYKVLLLDMDPQANATSLYLKTKARTEENISLDKTLMSAIADGDLEQIVTPILKNLYLLPSYGDFTSYPLFLEKMFPDDLLARTTYLSTLLKPLEKEFDFIL